MQVYIPSRRSSEGSSVTSMQNSSSFQRLRNGKNDGIVTNLDDVFHWSVQKTLG